MRIAIACGTNGWGGSEKIALDLARGLAAKGHAIQLFCKAGSPIHRRAEGRMPVAPVLGGADFSPVTISRSLRALRRFNAEILLANSVKDPRGIGVAARLLGIPFVYRKEVDEPFRKGAYHRLIYGGIVQHWIVASNATRQTMTGSADWIESSSIHVIPNGIDVRAGVHAEPADIPTAEGCTFGFVGRFEPRKGVFDLAAAWRQVIEVRPDDQLIWVGWGDGEDALREMLRDVPGTVWLGQRDDVPEVIKAIDVLVAPSHYEGFGLVLVEGMAGGKPVISTSTSSMPEILGRFESERLVPPGDPDALAAAMIALADDPWQRDLSGQKNQARAQELFDLSRMIDQHEQLLSEIVEATR